MNRNVYKIINEEKRKKSKKLNLSNLSLTSIPQAIYDLQHLTCLYLSYNRLNSISENILQLENLEKLYLGNNQIETIPENIGKLKSLIDLDLSYNNIMTIPITINNLKMLKNLNFENNKIQEIPDEIVELQYLENLNLSSNQLTKIPESIMKLTKLINLNLMRNQIDSIPVSITNLKLLEKFNLQKNNIIEIPNYICKLSKLKKIIIEDNPIVKPIEIEVKDIASIRNYFHKLEEDENCLYEAKLIIVGEPGAGKTTLAKKIIDSNYTLQENERSTKGIDIFKWQFSMENGKKFKVNIWDFGTQAIFNLTHQFFLTKRSLYLLVVDTRKEDTDFNYWLKTVKLYSNNSPLLIVKNEKNNSDFREISNQLKVNFVNIKEILTTNLATNKGLSIIIENIKHHIKSFNFIGKKLHNSWFKIRKQLEKSDSNYIDIKECKSICAIHGVNSFDDQLSNDFHDLGVCLHFKDDPLLKNIVILKPEWCTKAVYKIFESKKIKEAKGRFIKEELFSILNEDIIDDKHDELLNLMTRFQLCYEIPEKENHFIAPQLLDKDELKYEINDLNSLYLRYEYTYMPKGILTKFIVNMHRHILEQKYVWKTGVILEYKQTKAKIVEDYFKQEVRIRVFGNDKKQLLNIINYQFEIIHNTTYKGIDYEIKIPCNCKDCCINSKKHFYSYELLHTFYYKKNMAEIMCYISGCLVKIAPLIDGININNKNYKKIIFISYCRKDSFWKDIFVKHLNTIAREKQIKILTDDNIQASDDWNKKILDYIDNSTMAILLITPDFLTSDFISDTEIPYLLKRKKESNLKILPVIIKPCTWREIKWLSSIEFLNEAPLVETINDDFKTQEAVVGIVSKIIAID